MTRIKQISMICFVLVMMYLWSCDNYKSDNFGRTPYDPLKPVRIDGFEPDSGGLATKVFITGNNFGSDKSKIKVYFSAQFNEDSVAVMPAPVIGADGNHVLVYTPKMSGMRKCTIHVVSNGDSVAFKSKDYLYRTMYIIRTIAGRKGTTELKTGTLSEAEFHQPSTLTADSYGNIFMSHWRVPFTMVRINEEEDIVEAVMAGSSTDATYALGAPTVDADNVVSAISDGGGLYFTFDPLEAWTPRRRSILPSSDPAKAFTFSTAHSIAAHPETGWLYTRYYSNGHLIKINPETREGEKVSETVGGSDSYQVFDPANPNILYIAYHSLHCIYSFNLETGEHILFAGKSGEAGWQDGPVSTARFNTPNQFIVAPDKSLYVADRGNHCIRRITFDEKGGEPIVTTIIGKGGINGYQDGNPEDALFDNPRGVAVTQDGNIYITDMGNNVVRKLTIE